MSRSLFANGFKIFYGSCALTALVLAGCATSPGREISSAKSSVEVADWAAWAEKKLKMNPENLWASVAVDHEGKPRSVYFYHEKKDVGRVDLTEGTLSPAIIELSGPQKSFLELLAVHAIFATDPQLKSICVDETTLSGEVGGTGVAKFVRGHGAAGEPSCGLIHRENFVLAVGLSDLFARMMAPIPVLPVKKQRLNFKGDFDPADAFRGLGLDPDKIAIVVSDTEGEEQSYGADFFYNRYYLGGISFAQHPERWEDYSGIPSAIFHGRGMGTLLYILATFQLKDFSKMPLISEGNRSGQADSVWENLVSAGWAEKSFPPGSLGIATYRFNMEALRGKTAMKKFSSRRTVIKIQSELE